MTQVAHFHKIILNQIINIKWKKPSSIKTMLPLLISVFSAAPPWCWTGHPPSSITAIGRGCHLHTSLASHWRRRHYFTPRPRLWLVERCQHSHLAPGHHWPLAPPDTGATLHTAHHHLLKQPEQVIAHNVHIQYHEGNEWHSDRIATQNRTILVEGT